LNFHVNTREREKAARQNYTYNIFRNKEEEEEEEEEEEVSKHTSEDI
jgi:hypothetical protein